MLPCTDQQCSMEPLLNYFGIHMKQNPKPHNLCDFRPQVGTEL